MKGSTRWVLPLSCESGGGQKGKQSEDWLGTPGRVSPTHPLVGQHWWPLLAGPVPALAEQAEAPVCLPEPHKVCSAWSSFPAATTPHWGPSLAAFLGCCRIDYFGSLFAGDINLAGSRDGCVLTSHPGLDSVGSRCPWASRRWRAPGSLGQALEPVDFQEQMLGSPSGSSAPPTCLPPNRPGELLKMQFPFIFPVKSLPVP